MKRILGILLCFIGIETYAVDYTPFGGTAAPTSTTMQSVNNASYMSTGSTYSTAVHEVGAYTPANSGPRKSGFHDITVDDGSGTTEAEVDPKNTQYGPVGDALIPLLLITLMYTGVVYLRRRKSLKADN